MIFTDKEKYALSFQTEIKLELEKIKKLLELLGNPQDSLKFIHVAGTNGKGSVCAFLESILIESGKKAGKFSSPELVKKNETIRVCGQEINDADLKRLINFVSENAETMQEMPSPFEIMCAVAFLYFKEKQCEIVILETGMGGEGDATNVIKNAEVCILTHIALDHMQYLGTDITKITRTKSGIIKNNSKVVTLENNGDFGIIEEKCTKTRSEIFIADNLTSVAHKNFCEVIEYKGDKIKLSLCGVNQVENVSLAIKTAEVMEIDEKYIKSGITKAENPGRFEKIAEDIYFDGAHNPDGAKALRNSLDRYIPSVPKNFIMGVMADKEFSEMLEILDDGKSEFVFVNVQNNQRAMKNIKMAEIAEKAGIKSEVFETVNDAVLNTEKRPLFICGSLYLYKDVKLK